MPETSGVLKTVYSVADFLDWQRSGTLDLRPYFQRNSVWSKSAKSYFMDTLIRGFPVPLLLLQSTTDAKTFKATRRVVDGQQRLRTVLAYVDPSCLKDFEARDDFTLMGTHNRELAGRSFTDLTTDQQQQILNTEFSVHVLGSGYRREQILEVFARMNSTGRQLNGQELRNAEFHGEMKQSIYELAYQHLESWQRWRTFTIDQIAEMKEVEFTSELVDYVLTGIRGKSPAALRQLYRSYDESFPRRDEVSKRLRSVLSDIDKVLTNTEGALSLPRFGRQGWLYVLFAILHDARYGTPLETTDTVLPKAFDAGTFKRSLAERHATLVGGALSEDVLKATRGAASDVGSRRVRLRFLLGSA